MTTVFLYGEGLAESGPPGWVAGLPARPAWVRGVLWRGARPQHRMVPGEGAGTVDGTVIEVDPARLAVLDLVLAGPGVERRPVRASVGLRPVRAEAWVLPDTRVAEREGYRPLRRSP